MTRGNYVSCCESLSRLGVSPHKATGCRLRDSLVTCQWMTEGAEEFSSAHNNSPHPAHNDVLVSTQLRNLVTISPTGETRPPPCTPHGANNSNAICGTIKSGWRRSLFVCCKMSLDSIWVLTVDSRHKVPHSDSLTMGQFYCIPSPPFEISTEGERIMNTTTKITTEVTLVLFSLRVVTRAQNIYTVFTKLAWGNSIFYPANIYV